MIKRLIKYISSIVKPTINHTSVDDANDMIVFLQKEIKDAEEDQSKVDQHDFSDYPTLTNRRQS